MLEPQKGNTRGLKVTIGAPGLRLAPLLFLLCLDLVRLAATQAERRITVTWSGGIDSTAVLTAFFSLRPDTFTQAGVTLQVLYNSASRREFPGYASNFLEHLGEREFWVETLEVERIPDGQPISDHIDLSTGITVTGEFGDQIFGSALMQGAFKRKPSFIFRGTRSRNGGPHELKEPWQPKVEQRLTEMNFLKPERIQALMTLLGKQAKCCPFPIVTTFDWLWWVNFSMKWQYVGLRMLNRQEVLGRDRAERLHHFFGSHAFQGWALSPEAHAVKFPLFHSRRDGEGRYAWPVYKSLLKAYIHVHALACGWRTDQRPLLRYFKHKEKEGSKHQPGRNFAMDEDFNVIRFGGFSCSVAAAQETYGRQLTRYVKGRRLEGPVDGNGGAAEDEDEFPAVPQGL